MKKEYKLRIIHLSVAVLLTAALAVSLGLFAARSSALGTELGARFTIRRTLRLSITSGI